MAYIMASSQDGIFHCDSIRNHGTGFQPLGPNEYCDSLGKSSRIYLCLILIGDFWMLWVGKPHHGLGGFPQSSRESYVVNAVAACG